MEERRATALSLSLEALACTKPNTAKTSLTEGFPLQILDAFSGQLPSACLGTGKPAVMVQQRIVPREAEPCS